ncbi:hypothetical protein AGABI2DRAFT_197536 [Agaricus bisporus var. bisporus H97]|uniref:hypothetical protein n=1 Tax=Agaricus bisporus var. bisporus (strain H97 / ATCC MYA-4626 / FGSC 10389) TaxID=936046 RepID=UPI00029F7944|nr:hypothetical protein AGABI2DRAFT_197536 [Agaricus bisporus var. bisporus H97]EKV51446.1 hypothetical protein AGABI2DRAFT_197536 [Agaricus bisporus var. bisporus H97]
MSHPSLAHTTGTRRPPPPHVSIVTAPPWARDEPPSPVPLIRADLPAGPSDAASTHTLLSQGESRWWSFTLPRHRPDYHRTFRDFLPASPSLQSTSFYRKAAPPPPKRSAGLSLPLPDPTTQFTRHQVTSPGWDSPWTTRSSAQGPLRKRDTEASYFSQRPPSDEERQQHARPLSRRKQVRRFIFTNPYVPILFRVINIAFTTSALGMAIQIRKIEMSNHAMGAVGSSPTVVIIFAPLTLLHVMAAIYLEYFGRPVGLWQTSGKLAHTLSEVLFICAWSAALSLCFDNFFTSLIPCASESHISWYNELPRPDSNVPELLGSAGDDICQNQLSLIILVGIGLIAYCSNLVISLYRIFEKVKYQPHQQQRQ